MQGRIRYECRKAVKWHESEKIIKMYNVDNNVLKGVNDCEDLGV